MGACGGARGCDLSVVAKTATSVRDATDLALLRSVAAAVFANPTRRETVLRGAGVVDAASLPLLLSSRRRRGS